MFNEFIDNSAMNRQVENLKEFICDLIVPQERKNVNFIKEHVTLLRGHKNERQVSKKQKRKRLTQLSRREYAALGLNCLPTKQMKYEEAIPLHRLWKGYIRQYLSNTSLQRDNSLPAIDTRAYDAFCKKLVKLDLHGAKIRVTQSKCSTLVDIAGIVLIDTKNVFKILSRDHRLRTVPKPESAFAIKVGNADFIFYGKDLAIRPAERAVKKIKSNISVNVDT